MDRNSVVSGYESCISLATKGKTSSVLIILSERLNTFEKLDYISSLKGYADLGSNNVYSKGSDSKGLIETYLWDKGDTHHQVSFIDIPDKMLIVTQVIGKQDNIFDIEEIEDYINIFNEYSI